MCASLSTCTMPALPQRTSPQNAWLSLKSRVLSYFLAMFPGFWQILLRNTCKHKNPIIHKNVHKNIFKFSKALHRSCILWGPSNYRALPSNYRATTELPSNYRATTEHFRAPSNYRATTEQLPSTAEQLPSNYRALPSNYRATAEQLPSTSEHRATTEQLPSNYRALPSNYRALPSNYRARLMGRAGVFDTKSGKLKRVACKLSQKWRFLGK